MKSLIRLFAVAFCLFVALGWYLDWYQVASLDSPSGTYRFEIEVRTNKIWADFSRGKAEVCQILARMKENPDKAASGCQEHQEPSSPADDVPPDFLSIP